MGKWWVKLEIFLKEGILDPQGNTINSALHSLGFEEVEEVRMGKILKLKMEGETEEEVRDKVKRMSEIFLANPVTENFEIKVEKICE
ncbi:MAG: phosphoribosylformylglycinamidine synthase subunit PurS [Dictyoglomus sp.]|nr:phosphoribosylformylglycinamidine synthase subunit PurS [Dictyoglomus sp.]MCX7941724.1 phosphoribosylformylglycinamidine synthase subunit PurS [Dictyoglomaceae bacterium]MDW8189017.1 phosphoribosylformylglycinamidine synthase subunit PurS [Dictyoglomus sp.]